MNLNRPFGKQCKFQEKNILIQLNELSYQYNYRSTLLDEMMSDKTEPRRIDLHKKRYTTYQKLIDPILASYYTKFREFLPTEKERNDL